ncbi:hypothetical protein KOM00_10370 [Geomonas sp. Red69]|uniref:ACT domain-containing protein n=1 Tax=Geomonas diazotrophica TaxID=2843197 RepID=A0ABX8JQN7_9BACT|nr:MULTISPECIES: hypothetical protein [Geomonas]MBU5637137.1 hypothetical protein [Geomonas diazotrophica]QWV99436.1 hypothetical protein KP005_09220 [Geomonas nitrogeniifigens]
MNSLATMRSSATDTAYAGFQETGFTIEPIYGRPGGYRLGMAGFLAPGWSGRLAAGLSEHRVGIVRGSAEKVNASNWRSSFELKSAPFAGSPEAIDFLRLANTEPDRKAACIELLSFTMEPTACHNGSLFVELEGVDRLGFLGDLLDYFSMRCLFPVKMTVDTQGDTAVDRFWLRGVGGSVPSEAISDSMKRNLEQLLVR